MRDYLRRAKVAGVGPGLAPARVGRRTPASSAGCFRCRRRACAAKLGLVMRQEHRAGDGELLTTPRGSGLCRTARRARLPLTRAKQRDENVVRLGVVPLGELPDGRAGIIDVEALGTEAIEELGNVEALDRRGPRPRAAGIVRDSYRAPGADSRAAPAGCRTQVGPRRSSNAARAPAASATRRPFRSTCGTSLREARLERETRNSPGADGASATAGAAVAALRSRTAARRSQPLTTVGVEGRCRPNPDPAPRRPSPRPGRSSPVSLIVTAGIAISGGRPG